MNSKIYEIKSGAASNYRPLLSTNGQYFYWNSGKFPNNKTGDVVFVVNRHAREALYTIISETGIAPTYDSQRNISHFNDQFQTYEPQGEWREFIRFEIKAKVTIPDDWNWTRQLGQSETYDLWKPGIKDGAARLEKVRDLQKIFPDGEAQVQLQMVAEKLDAISFKGYEITAMDDLLQRADIVQMLESKDFWFEYPKELFAEFLMHQKPADFYNGLLNAFKQENELSYPEFIQAKLPAESEESAFTTLMGKLISYMDTNAAHKNIWNQYPDKRVYAKAGIRMGPWITNLIRFKATGNDWNALAPGIRNALEYANDPELGITIVSEDHKAFISENILHKPYIRNSFIAELKAYFSQYNIHPANPLNLTCIYGRILYADQVKPIWKKSISGLVAIDPNKNNWMEDAIADVEDSNGIVLWWSKMPTGTTDTIHKLRSKIQRDKSFELFYIVNGVVQYRAEVIDMATAEDYDTKNWKELEDIAWVQEKFPDYADDTHHAAILLLVQSFEMLKEPFSPDAFTWYNDYTAPRRDNLQPFEDYNIEKTVTDLPAVPPADPVSFITEIQFEDEQAYILAAIQTKPFILLAGISGTGKSRLVRSLAYHTCSRKELQHENRPGNFELIMVLPNWHDSSELVGYESRLSGKPEYKITPFLRFLVKARRYPDVPFFICLDEMNLAPVEQYFAEFLSIIETRKYKEDGMVSDPFLSPAAIRQYSDDHSMGPQFWVQMGIENDVQLQQDLLANGLQLPGNLVVMGTVNMDETTHSFSRKVLDRAMTIEMNEVDLERGLDSPDEDLEYPVAFYHQGLVLGSLQGGREAYEGLTNDGKKVIGLLKRINEKLDATPFKLAYRVRDEMLVYCYHCSKTAAKPANWLEQSMDSFLLMKLLARIEGDATRCENPLKDLYELLDASFTKCRAKITQMLDRLEHDNYTSFWN